MPIFETFGRSGEGLPFWGNLVCPTRPPATTNADRNRKMQGGIVMNISVLSAISALAGLAMASCGATDDESNEDAADFASSLVHNGYTLDDCHAFNPEQ